MSSNKGILMKRIIKAVEIEKEFPGTGRDIGRALGSIIKPGNIIDFDGLVTTTNSFADQFIMTFVSRHSCEAINTLKFFNAPPLLKTLIKRAIMRRTLEDSSVSHGTLPKRQQIRAISPAP